MGLNIGKTKLKYGLMLAPMAGVTDSVFRLICKKMGAEYTVSEMISAKALCYEQNSKRKEFSSSATAMLATIKKDEDPIAIQIFGRDPEFMAHGAELLATNAYKNCISDTIPAAIDINMGCPVKKIVGNGEGSALMREPALAGKIAEEICKRVSIPVTAKIRAGWNASQKNAAEVAKHLENAGVSAICVHGRTRDRQYAPGIDLDIIRAVKESVSVPVIGNGDIYCADDAKKMLDYTGCDGIMVGRGAMGNPWIFSEIISALDGTNYTPPSLEEKISLARSQLRAMIQQSGERVGIAQAKKHMAWYISGMRGCTYARTRIMTSESEAEINEIFDLLMKQQDIEE